MNIYKYPTQQELKKILERPSFDITTLFDIVKGVLDDIRLNGDTALKAYEKKFDKVDLKSFAVTEQEFADAEQQLSTELKAALVQAHNNIHKFHKAQQFQPITVNVCDGVVCRQKAIPIENVGLYVPGGSAPLFSTVLMLATPAQIAGCKQIVLCTPPDKEGKINPAILYAAKLCGVKQVYKAGGSQAIAAMTFGTESIPKVDKIFGPGNQFVMAAKQMATLHGVAIDMPAGPSEVAIIADRNANATFVAADLLSQAEHGPDSQVILLSDCEELILEVEKQIEIQLQDLPRKDIAEKALEHSLSILTHSIDEAITISNQYAPEHLILATDNYKDVAEQITCAGSVFEGKWSCESAGDYASGTNHTLPTKGYAHAYGGLSLDSYIRKMTFQELSEEGIRSIGKTVMEMADKEGLDAHRNAMRLRYNNIK